MAGASSCLWFTPFVWVSPSLLGGIICYEALQISFWNELLYLGFQVVAVLCIVIIFMMVPAIYIFVPSLVRRWSQWGRSRNSMTPFFDVVKDLALRTIKWSISPWGRVWISLGCLWYILEPYLALSLAASGNAMRPIGSIIPWYIYLGGPRILHVFLACFCKSSLRPPFGISACSFLRPPLWSCPGATRYWISWWM